MSKDRDFLIWNTHVNYVATGSWADLNLAGARLSLARVTASAASSNCAFCSIKNAVIFYKINSV